MFLKMTFLLIAPPLSTEDNEKDKNVRRGWVVEHVEIITGLHEIFWVKESLKLLPAI